MKELFSEEKAKIYCESIGYKYHGSEIKNKRRMIEVTCNNNHRYTTRWDQFKNGCMCKECQRLTYDVVKNTIEDTGYILLSDSYKRYHDKLEMKCPNGHTIKMQYANFIQGKRCKYCANNVKHNIEFVQSFVESEGYELLSNEYNNWETMLKLKCPNGHIFSASYNSFQQGHRCPSCSRSIGEERIMKLLDDNSVVYIPQYKFDDCVNKKQLIFDFYLCDVSKAIEYQGRQHYEPVDFFGGEKALEEQKIRDNIKEQYCKDNNIDLIIIPYWDYEKIDNILKLRQVI